MAMGRSKERRKQVLKKAIQEAFAEFIADNEWDLLLRLLALMLAQLDAVRLVRGRQTRF